MNCVKSSKPDKVTVGNVTVKIYKRDRATATGICRTVYEVADRTTGTRRLRGFSDHKEAGSEALKIAQQLASGLATAITRRRPATGVPWSLYGSRASTWR